MGPQSVSAMSRVRRHHAETSFAEWRPISVSYLYEDAVRSGNLSQCERYYELMVKDNFTLAHLIDAQVGLIDITTLPSPEIDWPSNMRDCYVENTYSTIVNAYAARASSQMATIAKWLGRDDDAARYNQTANSLTKTLNQKNFDRTTGKFCDGVCRPEFLPETAQAMPAQRGRPSGHMLARTTNHTSWHSSVYMLAFGLVADAAAATSTFDFVRSRLFASGSRPVRCESQPSAHPQGHWPAPGDGMPGNVYSAAFALQALYVHEADHGAAGLQLLTSDRKNTWLGQIASGATTTKEAWDVDEKPNLTWSHPWGASPAWIIPTQLLGITATSIGFASVRIKPQLGALASAAGKLPTVRGPIAVSVRQPGGEPQRMVVQVAVPGGVEASVWLPAPSPLAPGAAATLCVDGAPEPAESAGAGGLYLSVAVRGRATVATVAEC